LDSNEVDLCDCLLSLLMQRYPESLEEVSKIFCSVVYSAFLQSEKYIDCDIFYKFCTKEYKPVDFGYFMFVRALIEREMRKKLFNHSSGSSTDIRTLYLSHSQLQGVLENLFGVGKTVAINRFKQKINEFDDSILKAG